MSDLPEGAVLLHEQIIPVLEMLIGEFNARNGPFQEAQARLNKACVRAVTAAGLDPKEFEINWDLKAFTPRKKQ